MRSSFPPRSESDAGGRVTAPLLVASLLALAAGLHLAVAVAHLAPRGDEPAQLTHGLFFLGAALTQAVAAAVVAVHPHLVTWWALLVGQSALAAMWAAAVTTGLPGVPGTPEAATVAGIVATGAEALVAAIAVRRLTSRPAVRSVRSLRSRATLAPTAAVVILGLSGLGATGAVGHDHDHDHGAGAHLHGLGGDPHDPGPDPSRAPDAALDGTAVELTGRPSALAVDARDLWAAQRDSDRVELLAAGGAHRTRRSIAVGGQPSALALGRDAVWVASSSEGTIDRLDRETGRRLGTTSVGSLPVAVEVAHGTVWVVNGGDGTVVSLDPETGAIRGHVEREPETAYDRMTSADIPRVGYGAIALDAGPRWLWVVNSLEREVVRIDPRSARVVGAPIPVGRGATDVLEAHGRVWVANATDGTVTHFDPEDPLDARVTVTVDEVSQPGMGPSGLVATRDAVWVANNHDKTLVPIDPGTGAVGAPRFFGNVVTEHPGPMGVAASGDSIWVAAYDDQRLVRMRV